MGITFSDPDIDTDADILDIADLTPADGDLLRFDTDGTRYSGIQPSALQVTPTGASTSATLAARFARAAEVADETGATDQAKLNAAATRANSAGVALVLPPTLAPTAAPNDIPSGVSVMAARGGSQITPAASATNGYTVLSLEGTGVQSLTLNANASVETDAVTVTSVAGLAEKQVVHFFNPDTSPVTPNQWATTIRAIDTTNKIIFLSDKLPFALSTSSAPTIEAWTAPYENAEVGDIALDGSALTGEDLMGVAVYYGKNLRIGKLSATDFRGLNPAVSGNSSRGIDLYRMYGCHIEGLRAIRSSAYESGAININGLYNSHIGFIYSEDSPDDGPLLQYCDGLTIGALYSFGASGGNSGRGFKLQHCRGVHIGHAIIANCGATGAGFLYGTQASVDLLEVRRPRLMPAIVSVVVSSNIGTVTTLYPHNRAVGDTIELSGLSDGTLNADHVITEVVGNTLTSTSFRFAVTTSNQNPAAGTPVFVNDDNPMVWAGLGSNRVHIKTMIIRGGGLNLGFSGRDFDINNDSVIVIDTLFTDAVPTYTAGSTTGGAVAGVNLVIRNCYVNGVLTAGPWNPLLTGMAKFSAADTYLYGGTSGAPAEGTITAAGRAILDDADAAAQRTTLGLAIGTNVQAYDADLASWASVTRASGFDTFAATPSSANLRSLLTDETGTGAAVFATQPTIDRLTVTVPSASNYATLTDLSATDGQTGFNIKTRDAGGTQRNAYIYSTKDGALHLLPESGQAVFSDGILYTPGGGQFIATASTLNNGAGAGAGTITNAPSAGNPTKWVPINDAGTIRYIPAW